MPEGVIQLPPDDPGGKKLRTEVVTEGANQVHQEVVTLALADGTLVSDYPDAATLAKVEAVRALLAAALDVSDRVGRLLGHVTVDNFPAGFAVVGNVEITNDVGNPLPVNGTVALDAPTLAALETVNVTDGGGSLTVDGTVALDAGSLAALEVITIANPTTNPETGLAKDATLVPAKGFKVRDDWASGELLAEQSGAGAVLTFTFATAVDFIWVTDIGSTTTNICHVDPFGGAPTASLGIPVPNLAATPIYVTPAATVIKVHAPAGAVVNVAGYRRA